MNIDWTSLILAAALSVPISIAANLITPSVKPMIRKFGLTAKVISATRSAHQIRAAVRVLTLPNYGSVRAVSMLTHSMLFGAAAAYMTYRANEYGEGWPAYFFVAWEAARIASIASALASLISILDFEDIARDPVKIIKSERQKLDAGDWSTQELLHFVGVEVDENENYGLIGYEPRFNVRRQSPESQASAD